MKFVIVYKGHGANLGAVALPVRNKAEIEVARGSLRSSGMRVTQIYTGNPTEPPTWRDAGTLAVVPLAPKEAKKAAPRRAPPRKPNGAAKVRWRVMQGGVTLASGYAQSVPKARIAGSNEARKKAVRAAGHAQATKSGAGALWEEGFHVAVNGQTRYPLSRRSAHLRRVWS